MEYDDLQLIRLAISAFPLEGPHVFHVFLHHLCTTHMHTLSLTHPPSSHSSYPSKLTLTHLHTYKHLLTHIYIHRLACIRIHHHTYHILTNSPILKHRLSSTHTHAHSQTHTLTHIHALLDSSSLQRLVDGQETSFICFRSHSTTVYSRMKTTALGHHLWVPSPRLSC